VDAICLGDESLNEVNEKRVFRSGGATAVSRIGHHDIRGVSLNSRRRSIPVIRGANYTGRPVLVGVVKRMSEIEARAESLTRKQKIGRRAAITRVTRSVYVSVLLQ